MCAARRQWAFVVLVLAAVMLPVEHSEAVEAPFAAYGRLLGRYVAPGEVAGLQTHLVDYQAWAADPDYPQAIEALAAAKPPVGVPDREKIAFWINAYNFLAIKTVLDRYPMESIRDGGNFIFPIWKKTAGKVGGADRSLDEIEHEILRGQFAEPRVHMALVCASLSCPDLRVEIYSGARLDGQLEDQSQRFLANRGKGLRPGKAPDQAAVSSIFRWFENDFEAAGGVPAWILAHADAATRAEVVGLRDRGISYLEYDWSLNDRARVKSKGE
ncbi:MAG: DUF547 domain-containing protein [Candidatus Binatia bacterium]|nr:DUF547 domain-containing protein [Candidatus Binatia bacterium]MDG2008464.1 DUF547 domain-containing protein [Candidatus Binatia bacterium]